MGKAIVHNFVSVGVAGAIVGGVGGVVGVVVGVVVVVGDGVVSKIT